MRKAQEKTVKNEEWRPVPCYEDSYEVSSMGRVRSKTRKLWNGVGFFVRQGQILKAQLLPNGYLRVHLSGKDKYVHRLVATAFLSNKNELPEVNHKNEDKTDNAVCNLEWCTRKYNQNYGTAKIRSGEKHRGQLVNNKPVLQQTLEGNNVACFCSALEASRKTGIDNSQICKAARGVNRTAGGYKWRWC